MDTHCNILFVYGTLLQSHNQFGAYLNSHSKFYKKGKFSGKLYDIGHYPGAMYYPDSSAYVYGRVYQLDDPDEVFNNLDTYEGISAENPEPHEYTRELIPVETDGETLTCWIYLYNWPVNEDSVIASGNYLEYKK